MRTPTDAQLWAQFAAAVLTGSTGSEYGGAMSEQAHATYAGRVADYALMEFKKRKFAKEELREAMDWKQPNINPPPTYPKPPPPPPPPSTRFVDDSKPSRLKKGYCLKGKMNCDCSGDTEGVRATCDNWQIGSPPPERGY